MRCYSLAVAIQTAIDAYVSLPGAGHFMTIDAFHSNGADR